LTESEMTLLDYYVKETRNTAEILIKRRKTYPRLWIIDDLSNLNEMNEKTKNFIKKKFLI